MGTSSSNSAGPGRDQVTVTDWFRPTLSGLIERHNLCALDMCTLMQGILKGWWEEAETAALLVALRMKGETAEELAAAAAVLRDYCLRFDTGREDLLDTCGTGGDGSGTFNISTATALVVAGTGVPVVKHGNRAISSQSGSADVLTALGVCVDTTPDVARACLDRVGMAFCLAPRFHPALARVGSLRRRLGVRTLFNCLGPLVNPAAALYQLLGVGRPEWLDRMAGALSRLGTRQALLVCGSDGLDEVTLSGATAVRQVRGIEVRSLTWTPEDFGLQPCRLEDLQVHGPEESAAVIRSVLAGEPGPALHIVLANAAAALLAAERVASLGEGVAQAQAAIADGRAARVLAQLISLSGET
jgi:anthranilate phosphoribosyltransferase